MACQAREPEALRGTQLTPARVSMTGMMATGASFTALTVIETIAGAETPAESVAVKMKLSTPLALVLGR